MILPDTAGEVHGTKIPGWSIIPFRGVKECLTSNPAEKLKGIIAGYEETCVVENQTESWIFYPNTNTVLVFYCGPDTPEIHIAGPMTRPVFSKDVKPGVHFSIHFPPARMPQIKEIPLKEILNQWLPIENRFSHNFHGILEELSKANGFSERIRIWESHFKPSRLDNLRIVPLWITLLLSEVSQDPASFNEKKISKFTGYTARHARDVFRRYAGITPKDYRRILRYKLSLYHLAKDPEADLAGLACDLGFFDQAHFINEFKRFHGSTPTQFINDFVKSPTNSMS